ncbi:putative glycoside hydrolase [Nocardia mangyaensis]|uniref:putative glycoside hydrolase n=1 Tax=Nocardia mangyaensis TaxID=2213200 RepID=UPI002674C1F6|nr:putative glycoside hydrolase [Nocardia mangyaensis]MDO3645810.1 putative glycoside hydrolase [Nocardia mangyaensis]
MIVVGVVLAVVVVALSAGFALSRSGGAPLADTVPPTLQVLPAEPTGSYRAPVVLRGNAIDAVRVSVGSVSVTPDPDGAFEIAVPWAPAVEVVAVDAAGNQSGSTVGTAVTLPRMRAVHVTAHAWSHEGLREAVLDLAREGRIDTVQLDIKDEDGVVGYDSQVPLARESGAVEAIYDAKAALAHLHDLGLQVVGRIVAFRDPTVAAWAWRNGRTDWVVQNPSGQPYSSHYGAIAFTNFAHPDVRRYNIDLAVEAAQLGFDGIMYDYVRRPDGSLNSMHFAGLTGTPAQAVADFLAESRDPVHLAGAHLSAAVYGIASTRPDEIAQDIPLISRSVDFVAPMVYPSHWNSGEYGVANPNAQPYDITFRSLRDFQAVTANTGATVIPWLQDFSLGVPYGDNEIRAQIDATRDAGIDSFFLWNAATRYHAGGIEPVAAR